MADKIKQTVAELFEEMAGGLISGNFTARPKVGLVMIGSEHGEKEMLRGAVLAQQSDPSIEVVVLGHPVETTLKLIPVDDEATVQEKMERMLLAGELDAAVTMHYSFPVGVSTVGRVVTPAFGKSIYIATNSGISATSRFEALVRNTIAAQGVAKACGNPSPTVGILNIEGARQAERALTKLAANGYPLHFGHSVRSDGGVIMRGNDLLQGVPDIMITDSLTGNVVMKMLSAFQSGGTYETMGDGYGPGVGEGYDRIINIISRASGAPVVAGALRFAGACAKGSLRQKVNAEFALARKFGVSDILASLGEATSETKVSETVVTAPPVKVVTAEIPGVEILVLEDAVRLLWQNGVYATSGMGCTGPIILVAPEDEETALGYLKAANYL